MSDLATMPAPATNGHGHAGPTGPRTVARRRSLPGGRAVLGGFLVAASATGVFAAWSASTTGPTASYVVVTSDVAPGERIERSDLAVVAVDLPSEQRRLAFTDVDVLVGAPARWPRGAGPRRP
jgi:flagella basal body P-ring formation protein FlgA